MIFRAPLTMVKSCAVTLSKIANDLRLMSSGPRAGFSEINLAPKQNGSSIMPGKVNPVIPEVINQIAFNIIGNDTTVTYASEEGQLDRYNKTAPRRFNDRGAVLLFAADYHARLLKPLSLYIASAKK